jgi:hypothetical protein
MIPSLLADPDVTFLLVPFLAFHSSQICYSSLSLSHLSPLFADPDVTFLFVSLLYLVPLLILLSPLLSDLLLLSPFIIHFSFLFSFLSS